MNTTLISVTYFMIDILNSVERGANYNIKDFSFSKTKILLIEINMQILMSTFPRRQRLGNQRSGSWGNWDLGSLPQSPQRAATQASD